MTDNPFSAGLLQWSHAMTLPWRLFGRPTDAGLLEGFRQRNILLDALFYDVKVVGPEEAVDLAPWKAGEGAILIVPPSGAGRLSVHADREAVLAAGVRLDAVAVAGVGSSALGTAAFARNVADALGRPVAAVVSGWGLADLLTEASGGFAWAAGLDGLYKLWERLDHSLDGVRTLEAYARGERPDHTHGDVETLLGLLADPRFDIDLLVGHSKGNLVIADALHALQRADRARSDALGEEIRVVAFSARVKMPRAFTKVTEVIGRWDLIGDFAMRREAPPAVVVPDAWHHTNTDFVGHIPVTKVLKGILDEPTPGDEAGASAP
ncbi:MAG: hypothetical protein LWW93_01175 [Hyphomicrobiales bacterium]|nr:hypothetical protein [Hyphomicrobiales bacterium]